MRASYFRTACPHDCPSGCGLEVERLPEGRIGRVRGDPAHPYTQGVLCSKVARYAERQHHPERLLYPLRRTGPKGPGAAFERIGWDEALDSVAAAFREAAQRDGPESVWTYHSGGTLGMVQRYGQERLRHVMGYSRFNPTICVTPSVAGWKAGVGDLRGPDPREMAEADLVVIWGGNVAATQIHALGLAARARRERGAKVIVIDTWRTPTAEAADEALILHPGTDGALACAVMHVLLREGFADREFLARHTDFDAAVEVHLERCTPSWAAELTGLGEAEIVDFARRYGRTPRSYIRLGFGFSRSRNGAAAVHAVSCLPSITNAWQHRGGGAFLICSGLAGLDVSLIQGLDAVNPDVRVLDQSRIGAVLTGDSDALGGGPPVRALLIQNGNPAVVSPDSNAVHRGLAREDLFLCVHEQFLTETARFADIVLPATTFLEHDDLYQSFGQTHVSAGMRMLEPAGECRSNHAVICALAQRLGAEHPGFSMSERELLDATLRRSGRPPLAEVEAQGWLDAAADFRAMHFLDGFGTPDGRFHFRPDWNALGPYGQRLPDLPSHAELTEERTPEHPFRLVAPGARTFLNTSFTQVPSSRGKEGRPAVLVHPRDADDLALKDGAPAVLGNRRGQVTLPVERSERVRRGSLVVQGLWANRDFPDGMGINALVGADPVPPAGGVAFHDTAVWVRSAGGAVGDD